jgi:predicted nucleic acid-binding protein
MRWRRTGNALIAVDTNVVARIILADDEAQTSRARSLVTRETVLVRTTVVLEAYWVLRRLGKQTHEKALRGLTAFLGLPTVVVEEPERVRVAIDLSIAGVGFADALHLSGLRPEDRFASFDRDLARTSARAGVAAVVEP